MCRKPEENAFPHMRAEARCADSVFFQAQKLCFCVYYTTLLQKENPAMKILAAGLVFWPPLPLYKS